MYNKHWRALKRRKFPWRRVVVSVLAILALFSALLTVRFVEEIFRFNYPYQDYMPSPSKPVKVSKPSYKIVKSVPRVVTGYSAEATQTDSTPHITANGTDLRKYKGLPIVATNELPFGTKVRINGVVMVVGDRMNKRYPNRYDILFPNRKAALQWGKRVVAVEILK